MGFYFSDHNISRVVKIGLLNDENLHKHVLSRSPTAMIDRVLYDTGNARVGENADFHLTAANNGQSSARSVDGSSSRFPGERGEEKKKQIHRPRPSRICNVVFQCRRSTNAPNRLSEHVLQVFGGYNYYIAIFYLSLYAQVCVQHFFSPPSFVALVLSVENAFMMRRLYAQEDFKNRRAGNLYNTFYSIINHFFGYSHLTRGTFHGCFKSLLVYRQKSKRFSDAYTRTLSYSHIRM